MRSHAKPWLTLLAFNYILVTADPAVRSPPLNVVDQPLELTEQRGTLYGLLEVRSSPLSQSSLNDKVQVDNSCRFPNGNLNQDGAKCSGNAQDPLNCLSSRSLSSLNALSPLATSTASTTHSAEWNTETGHPLDHSSTCQNIYAALRATPFPHNQETSSSQSSLPPAFSSSTRLQGRSALHTRGDYDPCTPNECRDSLDNCHLQAIHACQVAGRRREYCRERFSRRCRSEYLQCDYRCSSPSQDPDDDKVTPSPIVDDDLKGLECE